MFSNSYRILQFSFIILLTLLTACGDNIDQPQRETPVGREHRTYYDEARSSWVDDGKRPLSTVIWYPAQFGTTESEWEIDIFKLGFNAPNAPIMKSAEKFPLVVLSHGTGGSAIHFSWLAEKLASNGYIVAAVNHHGNTAAEEKRLPQGFSLWWERAKDMPVLIDNLLADPQFGNRIDQDRIAMGGFSLGGYTTIAVAGGQIDFRRYGIFCDEHPENAICVMPPESDYTVEEARAIIDANPELVNSRNNAGANYRDPRLKAFYAIAPVMGPAFSPESLGNINNPVKITVGDMDDQAAPEYNARVIAEGISSAELMILPNVTHYTFLSRCTFTGKMVAGEICNDEVSRAKIHEQVSNDALSFYNRHLK